MQVSRRVVLGAAMAAATGVRAADSPLTPRTVGNPDAKVHVVEYFSLTCTHCAEFQRVTFPQIKRELIDTGKVQWEWQDFPLDKVALAAAAVARALPPQQYEPFISALLGTQDKWAFARGADTTEELAKMAALAGMPRAAFDKAVGDEAVQKAILTAQDQAEKEHDVSSTPTFLINGKPLVGAVDYATFLQAVNAAQS